MARKKKRKRRYTRKKKRYAKRRQMGVLGKAGAIIAGVSPVVTSAIGAAAATTRVVGTLPIMQKLEWFGYRFINDLVSGFGLPLPFPNTQDHGAIGNSWGSHTPHLYTTIAGIGMVLTDWLVAKLLKTSTRVAGVSITGRY